MEKMGVKSVDRNFYLVFGILIIAGIIGFVSYLPSGFETKFAVKMSEFPKAIGEWDSKEIPVPDRVYELLETMNVIMRDYSNRKNEKVNFTLVYSQRNRKVSHPPEICLEGGGATIIGKTPVKITDSIVATQLIIEEASSRELVVYWYKSGEQNTNNYLKNQFKTSLDRFAGKRTSSALIRLLTVIENNKVEEALGRVKSFAILIEPLLNKYIP
jgi:EpsI family protein